MSTIRERTNLFAELCNWIKELSNSIKQLTYTTNKPAVWENCWN